MRVLCREAWMFLNLLAVIACLHADEVRPAHTTHIASHAISLFVMSCRRRARAPQPPTLMQCWLAEPSLRFILSKLIAHASVRYSIPRRCWLCTLHAQQEDGG